MKRRAQIRRGRPADAAGIVALEALFPSDRMSARSVRRFLWTPSAAVWTAVAGTGVVGALVLLTRRGSRAARIYSLAVHPSARGQGLARRLVQAAEAEARRRGRPCVTLEVRIDNAAARALYAGLGYAERDQLPRYYEDGAPGLRLHKTLPV